MEIDITDFVRTAETHEFSASRAELGDNAGKITWANAVAEAGNTRWITDETRDEFEAWVKEFGAWSRDEIKAWSLDECNALLIQFISDDLNELESLCYSDDDEFSIDWDEAERLSQEGTTGYSTVGKGLGTFDARRNEMNMRPRLSNNVWTLVDVPVPPPAQPAAQRDRNLPIRAEPERASAPEAPRDRPQPPPRAAPSRSPAPRASQAQFRIHLRRRPVERNPSARQLLERLLIDFDGAPERSVVAALVALLVKRASLPRQIVSPFIRISRRDVRGGLGEQLGSQRIVALGQRHVALGRRRTRRAEHLRVLGRLGLDLQLARFLRGGDLRFGRLA